MSDDNYDIIEEGPASTVARTWAAVGDSEPQWIVVKSATTRRKFAKEPHDIIKELRVLSTLSHKNIVQVLGHTRDEESLSLNIWMPYIPISLSHLLASPLFSPHPFPPPKHPDSDLGPDPDNRLQEARFTVVARSITLQTLCALAYLHDSTRKIAHRDIKPNNILLTRAGVVQLIDFGIVWDGAAEHADAKGGDIWPEYRERMYFEVSTGPYRAPELLFGTRSYDAAAIDLWSLGATFVEFFTALRLRSDDGDDDDDYNGGVTPGADDSRPIAPFIVPSSSYIGDPDAQWVRDTLFNADRGEIGLAWSIFKIRGTPDAHSWPAFEELPDAKGVMFNPTPPVSLAPLLPNLPSLASQTADGDGLVNSAVAPAHFPPEDTSPTVLDLVTRLLVYPPARRLKALEALRHPWFTAGGPILMPEGYALEHEHLRSYAVSEWEGKTLGELVNGMLLSAGGIRGGVE